MSTISRWRQLAAEHPEPELVPLERRLDLLVELSDLSFNLLAGSLYRQRALDDHREISPALGEKPSKKLPLFVHERNSPSQEVRR
jgi:hypothetical protein